MEAEGASFPGERIHLVFSTVVGAGEGDHEVDAEEGGEGDLIMVLPAMIDEVATTVAGVMGMLSTSMLMMVSSATLGPGVLSSSGLTASPGKLLLGLGSSSSLLLVLSPLPSSLSSSEGSDFESEPSSRQGTGFLTLGWTRSDCSSSESGSKLFEGLLAELAGGG